MSSQGEASINQGNAVGEPLHITSTSRNHTQQGDLARIQKCLENITDQLGQVNVRLRAVESVTSIQNAKPRGGESQTKEMAREEVESVGDDDFNDEEDEIPRGAVGRGRGLGRGRMRFHENHMRGRHRGHEEGRNVLGGNCGHEEGLARNLGAIKLKLPQFHGRADPEAYLEWEKRVELIFECHRYDELTKVRIAVT